MLPFPMTSRMMIIIVLADLLEHFVAGLVNEVEATLGAITIPSKALEHRTLIVIIIIIIITIEVDSIIITRGDVVSAIKEEASIIITVIIKEGVLTTNQVDSIEVAISAIEVAISAIEEILISMIISTVPELRLIITVLGPIDHCLLI